MPSRFLAIALMFCFSMTPAGAGERHTHPDLKLLGSASPIPGPHVRCMKFLDTVFSWQFEQLAQFRQQFAQGDKPASEHDQNVRDDQVKIADQMASLKRISGGDWGVPPKATAEGMLKRAQDKLPADEAKLAVSRQQMRDINAGAGSWKSVSAARYYSIEIVYFDEVKVRQDRAFMSYARCVIENDLPATAR